MSVPALYRKVKELVVGAFLGFCCLATTSGVAMNALAMGGYVGRA
jgi:hypothetical protein